MKKVISIILDEKLNLECKTDNLNLYESIGLLKTVMEYFTTATKIENSKIENSNIEK